MDIFYLSPHLDDAVFSCGGAIWEQVQEGHQVTVVTLFSGDPPGAGLSPFALELHARWRGGAHPYQARREEDALAVRSLGAGWRHLGFLDCIYRTNPLTRAPLVQKNTDLFNDHYEVESELLEAVVDQLQGMIPPDAIVCSPLAVGGHLDHRFTRLAAETLERETWYYKDFPYAAQPNLDLKKWLPEEVIPVHTEVSAEGLLAWQNAVASYASQLSSFWSSTAEMKECLATYRNSHPGGTFWRNPRQELR